MIDFLVRLKILIEMITSLMCNMMMSWWIMLSKKSVYKLIISFLWEGCIMMAFFSFESKVKIVVILMMLWLVIVILMGIWMGHVVELSWGGVVYIVVLLLVVVIIMRIWMTIMMLRMSCMVDLMMFWIVIVF